MRQKRIIQSSLFDLFADHQIGRELKAISGYDSRHALGDRIQELNTAQAEMSAIMGLEVSEVYSPARVIKLAEKYGLQKGVA